MLNLKSKLSENYKAKKFTQSRNIFISYFTKSFSNLQVLKLKNHQKLRPCECRPNNSKIISTKNLLLFLEFILIALECRFHKVIKLLEGRVRHAFKNSKWDLSWVQ